MRKKGHRPTFAETAHAVKDAPVRAPVLEPIAGRIDEGGTFHDRQGRTFRKLADHLTPRAALAAAADGAIVVWDACGCGGYCGMTWFDPDQVARMVTSGLPTIRSKKPRRGNVSRWASPDGATLLIAEDDVRWGDVLT